MVQLVFLDSAPSSPSISLTSSPTDSIGSIRSQLRTLHPAKPRIESIRLIRGGKLLKDSESVADVLGKSLEDKDEGEEETHTIHLVIKAESGQQRSSCAAAQPSASFPASSAASDAASSSTSFPATSRRPPAQSSAQIPLSHALADAQAFYAYASRTALCNLLNIPSTVWHELEPKPIVSEEEAKAAVDRFMGAFGVSTGFGLGAAGESHEGHGDEDERIERWIPAEGASFQVEVDGLPYQLSIPPLASLTATQRTALQSYLSISRRLPFLATLPSTSLYSYLSLAYPDQHTPYASSSHSSHTLPHPPTHPAIAQRRHDIRLATVVPTQILSLMKYTMVWWIFTQNENWVQSSIWAAGLLAWWVYEGIKEWRRLGAADRTEGAARAAAPVAPSVAAAPRNSSIDPSPSSASTSDPSSSLPAAANPPPPTPLPTFTLPPSPTPAHYLSLLGLAYESHLLQLTPASRGASSASSSSPSSRRTTPRPPSLLQRILLPIFLFFLTVAPPLEQHRLAAIRAREKVMKEIMQSSPPSTTPSTSSATANPPKPYLPPNLSPTAKAYYLRVWKRGDRIDWNAEAEAQREMQEREERERANRQNGEGGLLAGLFM